MIADFSQDPSQWKETCIESEIIFKGKFFEIIRDKVEKPDKSNTFREYMKFPEVVVIIPILPNGNIILLKQYRYVIDSLIIELPAGKVDPFEDIEVAALRELNEETGYKAGKIKEIMCFYPTCGVSTEKMHLYLAEDLEKSELKFDEDEVIHPFEISPDEAFQMISRGEIHDLKTITGLLLLKSYLSEHKKQL